MSNISPPSDQLAADAVAEQLAKVLASSGFSNAPTLSRLLSYVVEQRLRGNESSLKEYALGVEVFARGVDFDPSTDTIVRVHARRLRGRLDAYYLGEGSADPIRIDIPKGRYEPTFCPLQSVHSEISTGGSESTAVQPTARGDFGRGFARLPAPRTKLIAREGELAQLCGLLSSDTVRLLTLTGTGGSGKTRLALQVAKDTARAFAGGVRLIDLAPVRDAETVVAVLAREFGVRHTGSWTLQEALLDHLRGADQAAMLLLLDNVEHLQSAVPLIGELLDACPSLTLLATSRVPLHLYGEHEYAVAPLALPDLQELPEGEALARVPAVALFVQRATAVNASVSLDGADGRAIAELLCRLDGLPLAIELAAPHARTLSPAQMLERFSTGLNLPDNASTDVPERQRTLRRTIDWSHDLLTLRERVLLRRLAVFGGTFSLEAAGAVADVNADLGFDVAAGLALLADKSLLQVAIDEAGPRFGMLDSIRVYARERLAESGEEAFCLRALAAYCLVLAEEGGATGSRHEYEAWLLCCDSEHDNFRAALDALVAVGDGRWALRLGQALFGFWERREHLGEGRQRLQAVLDVAGPDESVQTLARVRNYLATLEALLGDFDSSDRNFQMALSLAQGAGDALGQAASRNALATNALFHERFELADAHLAECEALCRELAHPGQLAGALSNRARCRLALGDVGHAVALLEEAQILCRSAGDAAGLAWCDNHLGDVAAARGEGNEAGRLYRQAMAAFERLDDDWGLARSMTDLGQLALASGDAVEASSLFLEGLAIFRRLGHRRGVSRLLEGCARIAASIGDSERALTLAGAAEAVRRSTGMIARPADRLALEASLAPVESQHSPEQRRRFREHGRTMNYERAIEYAMQSMPVEQPAECLASSRSPG